MPMLPKELRSPLERKSLTEECEAQFKMLAGDKGKIGADELVPVILHLSALSPTKAQSIGEDQVKAFMKLFDANEDGSISLDEFSSLVQFVMVSAHLQTEEGQALLE